MLIYTGTLKNFNNDVINGLIADKIEEEFKKHNFYHHNNAEYRSWSNSLARLSLLLNHDSINQDVKIAIEYQIPFTAKRVDFLITGLDDNNKKNAVIIELKQWEQCTATAKEDVVLTFLAGTEREVTHPSYQAYSYAKAIECFNKTVRDEDIKLYPCAFLHNYKKEYNDQINNPIYSTAISLAPLFLEYDSVKLQYFIKKYVTKPDNGQILYQIDNGKIKPSVSLQDAISSLMNHNEVFTLLDEQKVAYSTIMELISKVIDKDEKHTVIIKGGPGTGKSVIAMHLLERITSLGFNVNYITKNTAPRQVFISQLIKSNFTKRFVENLFKSSSSYINTQSNTFDCLLVDEAHRLNMKSGMFQNKGENQIKEIINASKITVFFIDEDQIVTTKDFGSVNEIVKQAKELHSTIHMGESLNLVSQFRCNGSDGYLAFLDNLLNIRETPNISMKDIDYDIKVFSSANEMREALRIKNNINNKSRMLAGYCYNWISKNDITKYDIILKDGFEAQWNFASTSTWAIDKDSFDQVGCIHTSQGLEFDYVGVIIGKDLIYINDEVKTYYTARAKTDKSLFGIKKTKDYALADKIIRDTYKTLLSRGQKGCYIYCEYENLSNFISDILKK